MHHKKSEKRRKCLMYSGIRVDTHGSFVNNDTLSACRTLQVNGHSMQQRCADCGRRCTVIVGSMDCQLTDFFIQRSRCCNRNECKVFASPAAIAHPGSMPQLAP